MPNISLPVRGLRLSQMKMNAENCYETPIPIHQPTRRHSSEDFTLTSLVLSLRKQNRRES